MTNKAYHQGIIVQKNIGYMNGYPHLKAHLVVQMHIHGNVAIEDIAEHYGTVHLITNNEKLISNKQ